MQMLCQIETSGFDAWKANFDADTENRSAAGLTVLQIWRDADAPAKVAVLFEITDRARAQGWLDTASGLGRGGSAQFLKTA